MNEMNYRIYHNNVSLEQNMLENIKEIIVDQRIDMTWEGRLTYTIYLDENGNWSSETNDLMISFSRVRIEIQSGESSFTPLIDGPVTGYELFMSSEPGESYLTIIFQDDSILLNLNDEIIKYEGKSDDKIVQEVFERFSVINEISIEHTKKPPIDPIPDIIQRGTAMHFLRFLARRQGMSAYILPSSEPGRSIGCFKRTPTESDNLEPLILLGSDRNIESFSVKNNAQKPSKIEAASLITTEKKEIITSTSNIQDIELLGDEFGSESNIDLPTRILFPHQCESVNLDQVVLAEANRLSYAIQVNGEINNNKYSDILQPYSVIDVYGVTPQISGSFLITGSTHNITPFSYSQSFELVRNARTSENASSISGGIF